MVNQTNQMYNFSLICDSQDFSDMPLQWHSWWVLASTMVALCHGSRSWLSWTGYLSAAGVENVRFGVSGSPLCRLQMWSRWSPDRDLRHLLRRFAAGMRAPPKLTPWCSAWNWWITPSRWALSATRLAEAGRRCPQFTECQLSKCPQFTECQPSSMVKHFGSWPKERGLGYKRPKWVSGVGWPGSA